MNRSKFLSITTCCVVIALWVEVRGMENSEDVCRAVQGVKESSNLPTGIVNSFAGEVAPHGWLMCDGQAYSNQRYSELYGVIGMKYTPNESWVIETNKHSSLEKFFHVPDLRGRVVIGIDSGANRITSNNTLGASGGEEKHQLTENELAKHAHSIRADNSGQGSVHSLNNDHISSNRFVLFNTDIAGGDQPHNNMQPYMVLNYIINAGKSATTDH